jgi:predicted transglutaminase-like cysteine proteinase
MESMIKSLTPFLLTLMILFETSSTSARTSAEFTQAELQAIKQKYGQIHVNLIGDYHQTIQKYKLLAREVQLPMVNSYLNTLLPGHDSIRNKQEEYWSTPKEFLSMGTGDCEDYVIIKYFTLIDLGFDENKLYFAIVREQSSINLHMVLLYEGSAEEPPLVLDNLSFRVLDLPARYDLELIEFFNTTGRYKYDKSYRKIRLNGQNREFIKLRERVRRGE